MVDAPFVSAEAERNRKTKEDESKRQAVWQQAVWQAVLEVARKAAETETKRLAALAAHPRTRVAQAIANLHKPHIGEDQYFALRTSFLALAEVVLGMTPPLTPPLSKEEKSALDLLKEKHQTEEDAAYGG